jgi:hypothetical protein
MKPGGASPFVADQAIFPNPLLVVRFVRRSLPLSPQKLTRDRLALDFPSPGFFRVTLDTVDL